MNAELLTHPANDQIEREKSEKERALTSAYWCYFLAAMIMAVTIFNIVEGVNSTEPNSPARWAKIAAGVLIVIIQGCLFELSGRWKEFSRPLQAVGWAMFVLSVFCMALVQYSTATTAGKAAALSATTANEILAHNQAVRDSAKIVQADSERLQSSKYAWKRDAGAKKSETALAAVASSAGNVEKLEKLQATAVSTPLVETLGPGWLLAFALVYALIFESASVVLMTVAGKLHKKAADGQPVDSQILALLRKMSAQPSPAERKGKKQADQEERKPADAEKTESDFEMGFVPRETKKQDLVEAKSCHDMTLPGELWVPQQRRDYILRPTRQSDQDAPAIAPTPIPSPAPAPAPKPADVPAPETTVSDRVQGTVSDRVRDSEPANTPDEEGMAVPVPATAPKSRVSKPRTAKPAPAVRYDTGTDDEAVRYRKVFKAVKAGQIEPSFRAIEKLVGCRQPVAGKFRAAMHESGLIEPDPEKLGQYRLKKGHESQLALQGV